MPAPDSTSPAPKKLYVAIPLEALADTLMDGIAPSTLYESEKTARKHSSTKQKKTAIVTVRARDAEREGLMFQRADGGWTSTATIEPHLLRCSDDLALERIGAKRKRSAGGLIVSSLDAPSVLLMYRIHGDAEAWKTPKGGIERGESKRDAARREVAEESGITRVKIVAPLGDVQYFKRENGRLREKTVHLYLMVNRDGETGIAPREGERFVSSEWLPFDEAVERVTQKQVRPIIAKAEKLLAGAKS
jgi:8-oxo-dGTP pyrophosphatase MutT (NUDIX family)